MNEVNCERQPVIFLPHAGLPIPPYAWQSFIKVLSAYEQPEYILVIHSDWVTSLLSISSSHTPQSVPANFVGDHDLPALIRRRLKARDIDSQMISDPSANTATSELVAQLYPNQDIPIMALSLRASGNAAEHLMLGEALSWLREHKVLIMGVGFPVLNNGVSPAEADPHKMRKSFLFDQWLNQIVTQNVVTIPMRKTLLSRWENAPHALYCHPLATTMLPLHLCCGAANFGTANLLYDEQWDDLQLSAFVWR